jgi:hypothetical protein
MKLWEVLKALEENPEKKFETDSGKFKSIFSAKGGFFHLDVYNDGRLIPQEYGGGAFNGNVCLGKEWQEIKQPVTWQEAIEAWANGKTIRCEDGGSGCLFSGGRNTLTDSAGPIDRYQITKGTWYIEEETK